MTERVAEEMGTFVGQDVGYSIRFDDCTDPNRTRIKVNVGYRTTLFSITQRTNLKRGAITNFLEYLDVLNYLCAL